MAKITDVTILNQNTIKLNQDQKAGDELDLRDINSLDTIYLSKRIEQELNQQIEKRLLEQKIQLEQQMTLSIKDAVQQKQEEIVILKKEAEQIENQTKLVLEASHQAKIAVLNERIEKQEQAKQLDLQREKERLQFEYQKQIDALKLELANEANRQKALLERQQLELEKVYQKELNEKQEQILSLTYEKSSLNIKQMGEKLESWCHNTFLNYQLSGFENTTWEKDTIASKEPGEIKGTKGDFIFKVFATKEKHDDEVITSALLEMKSEDKSSKSKKKNQDHFSKLDLDRRKKGLEYALLVSELEWDYEHDAPIQKVDGYEKMYIIRPPFFITFLSLIHTLAFKYRDIIVENKQTLLEFKETSNIIAEFETMKDDIINKTLRYLENEVGEMSKEATKIIESGQKLLTSTKKITEAYLQTIKNKLNQFKIQKITKTIQSSEVE